MFFLGKASTIHKLNFCSGMPLRKVHELTFLWFGLPGPLLRFRSTRNGSNPFLPIATLDPFFSGLQKGPAERGHIKNRQKSSKIVKKCQKVFRHFSTIFAQGKNRQKVPKSFSTLFDNFCAAPFFPAPFAIR